MTLNARFPLSSDRVQLSTATAAGDTVQNGILVDGLGTVARAATTGGTQWQNGLFLTPTSQVVYVDATAGLPAGTTWQSGLPLAPSGALCTSTDAVASWQNGLPHVANGAMAVTVDGGVLALFANGEQGGWYDPSDLTTLFQDSAGTTPVTAAGQPVGLMLDKSGRGNHLSQATATARPLYQVISGRPCLVPDGVDDFMVTAAYAPPASALSLLSTHAITKGQDVARAVVAQNGNLTTGSWSVEAPSATPGNLLGRLDSAVTATVSAATAETVVVTLVSTYGVSATIRKNATTTATSPATSATGPFVSAAHALLATSAGTMRFDGLYYGGVIRYSVVPPTPAQIAAAETWATSKTGAF